MKELSVIAMVIVAYFVGKIVALKEVERFIEENKENADE